MADRKSDAASPDTEAVPPDTGAAGLPDGQGTIVHGTVSHRRYMPETRRSRAVEYHQKNDAGQIYGD